MVYSSDLKSDAEMHAGSSPATRTIYKHTRLLRGERKSCVAAIQERESLKSVFLYGDVTSSQGTVAEQSGSLCGNAQENATTRKQSKLT